MEKPITVAREELISQIVDTINQSGLPAFVIADSLKDIHKEVCDQAKKQYERDFAEWRASHVDEDTGSDS